MKAKKTIAIIGASGEMGSALAMALVNSNYRILLMSRNTSKVDRLATNLKRNNPAVEVEVIECEKETLWNADIILLAVPYNVEKEVAEKIKELITQKIVIDISNPLNETYDHLITASGKSAAEELQKALPNSKVVKAFNTLFACDLKQPTVKAKEIKTFIAGDDKEAVEAVSEIAVSMGLKPVIAGNISESGKLEQMMMQLIELKNEENYNNVMALNIRCNHPVSFKSVLK